MKSSPMDPTGMSLAQFKSMLRILGMTGILTAALGLAQTAMAHGVCDVIVQPSIQSDEMDLAPNQDLVIVTTFPPPGGTKTYIVRGPLSSEIVRGIEAAYQRMGGEVRISRQTVQN